jgi:DNA-binding HxlR family transcriptional regulator
MRCGAILPRMLAVTLRHLERDGLVTRTVLPLSPTQVEYALTPLGRRFVGAVRGRTAWAAAHESPGRAAWPPGPDLTCCR